MVKRGFFGKVKVTDETVTYSSVSWSELSKTIDIAMYTTVPGTMESAEHQSVTLEFVGLGMIEKEICPACGLPYEKHEIRPEFVEKIKRREQNKPIRIKDINSRLVNQ